MLVPGVLGSAWDFIVVAIDLNGIPTSSEDGRSGNNDNGGSSLHVALGSVAGIAVLIAGLVYTRNQRAERGSMLIQQALGGPLSTEESGSVQSVEMSSGESKSENKPTCMSGSSRHAGAYSEIGSV
jgi:hypothetical protein